MSTTQPTKQNLNNIISCAKWVLIGERLENNRRFYFLNKIAFSILFNACWIFVPVELSAAVTAVKE